MSRLTALHIPFVSGHNDAVDARVMPDGVFADVRNGRLNKAGSLTLRRGWRPLTMTEMVTANEFVAHDLYSYGDSLVALGTLGASAAQYLATKVDSSGSRPWRAYRDSTIRPVTDVRAVGNVADMSEDSWYTSYALTSDGVYGCAIYQYSVGALSTTITRVFRTANDQTVALFSDTSGYAKVFSLGSSFGRVRIEGTNTVYATLNPTDSSPTFATVATLETANAGPFDVAVSRTSAPTHLHVVTVSGGAATYRRYTTAGVQSGLDKVLVAADVTHFPSIACDDVTARVLFKLDTGNVLRIITFASTGLYTTTAGPTTLFATDDAEESRFCVGLDASLSYVAAQTFTGGDVNIAVLDSSHSILDSAKYRSATLVSGWIFSTPYAGVGLAYGYDANTSQQGTFCYSDPASAWLWSQHGTAVGGIANSLVGTPGRVTAPAQTTSGDVLVGGFAFALSWTNPFSLFFRLNTTARRPGVVFANTLHLTGGVMTQWSSNDVVENGIAAPVIRSLTQGTVGSLTLLGTYRYRAVVTWFDEIRGLHRSVVSRESSITLTGANDSVSVIVDVPKTLRRNPNVGSNPTVTVFRTESGGELFYQTVFGVVDTTEDSTTLVDTLADASILDEPRVYTEGEFGAVSGVLDIAPPRPSAYAAAMRDRVVLGSAGPAYQVSQTLLPEEPIAFAEPGVSGPVALSYFDSVEGDLTGVATLDDTIVLGTADAIYVAGGEGPNLAGIGAFQSPARLPSDVGFYDWRAIIETSEGLWFLGAEDKLYLLPRGGGVPSFAGEAVQDRFTGEVVGAARETEDSIVAWAVAGADPALVVHDVDHGYWFRDDLPFTPVALTTHEGRMYAVADDGVVWEYSAAAFGDDVSGDTPVVLLAETGHIQVFAQTGQGRLGAVSVLGEVQNPANVEVFITYNDGASWATLGDYDISGNAGDTFERQFYPANQRGGRFRLRLVMTPDAAQTEGCRLTGLSVYYRTASGPSRQPSANRK